MAPWVDSPLNVGALSPTSIPNDVQAVRNRLAKMIVAKLMCVRVFIFSSCYYLSIPNILLPTSLPAGDPPPAVDSDVDPNRRFSAEDR